MAGEILRAQAQNAPKMRQFAGNLHGPSETVAQTARINLQQGASGLKLLPELRSSAELAAILGPAYNFRTQVRGDFAHGVVRSAGSRKA